MRGTTRHFLLSLAAALCGPLLGYAPIARAGFAAGVGSEPLTVEAASLPGFHLGFDLGGNLGAGALGGSTTSADLSFDLLPSPVSTDKDGRVQAQSFLPVRSGSGAGSAGGTTTGGPSGGAVTTTALPISLALPDVPGVLLALREASFLPPAFPSRLFRPPRKD
jgi:hypothetical protein